jgi:hypothetical protein
MAQMINLFFLLHLIYLFDEHVIETMDWEGAVSGAVSYVMKTGMISSIGTALRILLLAGGGFTQHYCFPIWLLPLQIISRIWIACVSVFSMRSPHTHILTSHMYSIVREK